MADHVERHDGLPEAPRHVACIMDGNGRWATRKGLARSAGHAAGELAMLEAVDGAIALGIDWLTLYTFSTENWNRPPSEVAFLMELTQGIIERNGEAFHRRHIRVRYMGRRGPPVPDALMASVEGVETLTRKNTGLTLTLAFNYGGQTEIVDAAARLAKHNRAVTLDALASEMYLPDMPSPDLVIRFGGERRLSNFMLWHIAYAELEFVNLLWPDVRQGDFTAAISAFQERTRRFGAVDAGAA